MNLISKHSPSCSAYKVLDAQKFPLAFIHREDEEIANDHLSTLREI